MKVSLKSTNWVAGRIRVYGTKQTISAESTDGPVTLVYERNARNPKAYTFKGVERTRPHPDSQFVGDLAPIVEHLPWDAVAKAQWKRAMTDEQQRRSYHE